MKRIVPCNVAITRYYRVYAEVEEGAGHEEIMAKAKEVCCLGDERELTPDLDMGIEPEDIRWIEPDIEGSWTEEFENESKATMERMCPNE